jgi:hypothetical protein
VSTPNNFCCGFVFLYMHSYNIFQYSMLELLLRNQLFTSLAKKLEMSLAHIGLSVERGELIAKYGNDSLEK